MAKYASRKAYGDAEGPFGFPMPSALASETEKVFKGLPAHLKELGIQRRSFIAKATDLKEGERADISLITSDALDRDSEVMLPRGANWKQFLKNPVVTFAHKYDELPAGRALWVKRVKEDGMNGYIAKTQYTSKPDGWEGPWMPDAIWHFIKGGDLRGKSIGFLITDGSPPNEKEITARPELEGAKFVIRTWLALEYAVAPVQSNPDAFVLAAAKARDCGLSVDMILDAGGLMIPGGLTTFDEFSQKAETEPEPEKRKRAKAKPVPLVTRDTIRKAMASADMTTAVQEKLDRLKGRV